MIKISRKEMTLTEYLRTYNKWRRGEYENYEIPDPKEVGEAIDEVIALLEQRRYAVMVDDYVQDEMCSPSESWVKLGVFALR